jgi:K+-transporting ATPase KdpF subunit
VRINGLVFDFDDNRLYSRGSEIYARRRAAAAGRFGKMNWETILAVICAVLLLIYLTYALLRPEKF